MLSAQIVEAEFVVGGVGNVAAIGRTALIVVEAVHDDAGRKPQEAIDLAHHRAVAGGEIVVDGDDVHALAGERIEIDGKRAHERLAFTRLHFGDRLLVQDHAADKLHIKGPEAEHAERCLAGDREGRHQNVVERLARGKLLPEFRRLGLEFIIGERLHLRFERIDGIDTRIVGADATIVRRTEQLAG